MSIVEEITHIYETVMPKNPIMLSHEEALAYFERMIMRGNVITYVVDGELHGYIEFWRIDYTQFGRLCCNWTLAHDEDLNNGNICLITGMYIKSDLRNGETFLYLGRTFLEKNKDATHFVAHQYQKKHKPLQVYSRSEVLKHYKID